MAAANQAQARHESEGAHSRGATTHQQQASTRADFVQTRTEPVAEQDAGSESINPRRSPTGTSVSFEFTLVSGSAFMLVSLIWDFLEVQVVGPVFGSRCLK